MKDLPMTYVNKNRVWGKDYLSTQWLQLVQQKFCFDWFPWQASICHWSKKKLTKAIPTPSLSHCSKDTVHIRSWTPESWVNLPSLPAESNLKLMCSNGTPVANKGEKSRELQLTHERHNQRAEEDTQVKNVRKVTVTYCECLIERNHWCMLEKAVR